MDDPFDLRRFVTAQDPVMAAVRDELRRGRKTTHWMWFVFPQIAGLGRSATARHFALASLDEAKAYLRHAVLGPRLLECTALVLEHRGRAIDAIFGFPDTLKFQSCMTLFAACSAGQRDNVFETALDAFFGGARDAGTVERLAASQ